MLGHCWGCLHDDYDLSGCYRRLANTEELKRFPLKYSIFGARCGDFKTKSCF
jgi:hypothetical protein